MLQDIPEQALMRFRLHLGTLARVAVGYSYPVRHKSRRFLLFRMLLLLETIKLEIGPA